MGALNYATMKGVEVYTSAPPFLPPGTEAGNIGPLRCMAENQPINWAEGRALHAANDCGETLYWRIGVAYLASEITSGLPVSHSWPTPGRMAAFESQKRAIPLKITLRVANHDVAAKTRV